MTPDIDIIFGFDSNFSPICTVKLVKKVSYITATNNLTQPPMMTSKMVKSAWANIGYFLDRIIYQLDRIHLKI